MVHYQPAVYKELSGKFNAEVVEVEAEANTYYDSKNENSTEQVLNISFQLEDPGTLEAIMFTQKFVSPLTGGRSLFQKLLDIMEFIPDLEGGDLDEKKIIGTKVVLTMGKNKKGYNTVIDAEAPAGKNVPVKKDGKEVTPPEKW